MDPDVTLTEIRQRCKDLRGLVDGNGKADARPLIIELLDLFESLDGWLARWRVPPRTMGLVQPATVWEVAMYRLSILGMLGSVATAVFAGVGGNWLAVLTSAAAGLWAVTAFIMSRARSSPPMSIRLGFVGGDGQVLDEREITNRVQDGLRGQPFWERTRVDVEQVISVEDAARYLGISPESVHLMIADGRFAGFRHRERAFVSRRELRPYVQPSMRALFDRGQ